MGWVDRIVGTCFTLVPGREYPSPLPPGRTNLKIAYMPDTHFGTFDQPQPAPEAPAAAKSEEDDLNIDQLIEQVLTRNRRAAESSEAEPYLEMPRPQPEPEAPKAPAAGAGDSASTSNKASTDALLEDLAFSLASDDPFVLEEPAPERAAEGAEGKDLEALFGSEVAETATTPAGPPEEIAPAPSPEESEDAFQAELDRRARERARAALEALSESRGGEGKSKQKPAEEDSDEALREVMNIPSFLRRTED